MVNATVDNEPVSIVLDGGQSTSVPSNETWAVSIYVTAFSKTNYKIDGIGQFHAKNDSSSSNQSLENVTLTGGQTITEITNNSESAIFITGFVVN